MPPEQKTAKPPSDAILERLSSLHPKIIDLSLGRVEELLASVGHPEQHLPPVVHIAGTNGKGSTLAFLRAMLEAAGHRVHAYTSPHLVRFHERIRLAGELIPEPELAELLEECEKANGGRAITYFEITTVAALLAFTRHPADVLLLEVGLGGRLDATNVVNRPRLSVITPVSIDHTHFLGENLTAIAGEKAGILKPGVAAVIAPQPDEARIAIEARGEAVGAPLFLAGRDWQFAPADLGFSFQVNGIEQHYPLPGLPGPHQIENAVVALACAEQLREFNLEEPMKRRGLAEAVWPGRLQRLVEGRLCDLLPPDWELWIDGGHNASAGEALARHLKGQRSRPLHLVYGMMRHKAADLFLKRVAPMAASISTVPIPGEPGALSASEAAAAVESAGFSAQSFENPAAALRSLTQQYSGPAQVLVCGSLYLAGRVLAANGVPLA